MSETGKHLPVLIVEDDADLREAIEATLEMAGYPVISAGDGEQALELLRKEKVGLVMSDVNMHPMDGYRLLVEIATAYPGIPVVLMTAFGDVEKAVNAMRCGASDYLLKPFEPASLIEYVEKYRLPFPYDESAGIIAQDPKIESLLQLARRVAKSSATVLITGESGTGKEVFARFIHRNSGRANGPFVAINCAAIPENLLEATLFGYEKGSFTGATQAQPGKFEQAEGGTLLLDEISEMPLALQAKLLRVLQEREVERVGGKKVIPLDIRVLATSNRDMAEIVAQGGFREDLYYRLNVIPLVIPPLREHPGDIVALARFFVNRMADSLDRHGIRLTAQAEERLLRHHWPGNVRELENVIQRAMILAPGVEIEAEDLFLDEAKPAAKEEKIAAGKEDIKSLEKKHIMETLASVNGSRKEAVKILGISERTLRYKLQQYRLSSKD
ncbi:MAG: sigma-54-dependent Fis family transcriptional regulator [Burkholderiales bacterium]|nr:sigma-54-dependent Fis family transcriptional regulator [Burkholderiales bacterium]